MAEQAHDGALEPDAPQHPPLDAPIQPAQKHTQVPGKKFVAARGLNINFDTSVIISKP